MKSGGFGCSGELYGLPVRAGHGRGALAVLAHLAGCALYPAEQLVELLKDDSAIPQWRRQKNKRQLDRVQLAQQLGVWSVQSAPVPRTDPQVRVRSAAPHKQASGVSLEGMKTVHATRDLFIEATTTVEHVRANK